jgi:DNA replication factor GINS
MNLEELRSVQDAERRQSGLQPLRESFYEEAGEYIADLKAERDRAADRADDPFSSTEVRQITDEIETAEEVLEAIYERRMGKLLKRASLAAAEMSVDDDGLTAEERELFDDLVGRITRNKDRVLETLAGEPDPSGDRNRDERVATGTADGPASRQEAGAGEDVSGPSAGTRPGPETEEADALVEQTTESTEPGSGEPTDPASATSGGTSRHEVPPEQAPEPIAGPGDGDSRADDDTRSDLESPPGNREGSTDGGRRTGRDRDERVTVRITDDVGAIYGVDDREYDLSSEDVVALPAENADPLVERGAAEPLDPS